MNVVKVLEFASLLVFVRVTETIKGVNSYSGRGEIPFKDIFLSFESKDRVPAPLHSQIAESEPKGTNLKGKYIAGVMRKTGNARQLVRWFYCPAEIRWLCENLRRVSLEQVEQIEQISRLALLNQEISYINRVTLQQEVTLGERIVLGQKILRRDLRDISWQQMQPHLILPSDPMVVGKFYAKQRKLFEQVSPETLDRLLAPPRQPNPVTDWQDLGDRHFKCRCCGAITRLSKQEFKERYLCAISTLRRCENCRVPNFIYKPLPQEEAHHEASAVQPEPIVKTQLDFLLEGIEESGNQVFVL